MAPPRGSTNHQLDMVTWNDADEVTLLLAAAAFRERAGRIQRNRGATSDAGVLLRSISPHINEPRCVLHYKLGRSKSIFQHKAPGESAAAHGHLVHDLRAKVWGFVNTGLRPRGPRCIHHYAGGHRSEVLDEYMKMNERALAGLPPGEGSAATEVSVGYIWIYLFWPGNNIIETIRDS